MNEVLTSPYPILCATIIFIFIATNLISFFVFEHIPHIQDSICQLFQAKIFLSGRLYASPPPHKEFFRFLYIIDDNKWYSQYPPLHSFFLMVGLLFNTPWLVNPIFGTLAVIFLYKIGREIYDLKTANLSLILFAASPFFIFMSSEYMNHSSTMFFLLLFIWYFIKAIKSSSVLFAFVSGISLGIGLNIRPLTIIAMGFPFIIYLLYISLKEKGFVKTILSISLGFSLMFFLFLTYNYLTNENPLVFGYNAYEKKANLFGFVDIPSEGIKHTPFKGVINTVNNFNAMNRYLFEWPIPSLSFVFLFFFLKYRKNIWDKLFILSSLSLSVAYFFHYFPNLTFGPRFLYCAMPLLMLLTARGAFCIPESIPKKYSLHKDSCEIAIILILLICILFTLFFSLPMLIKEYHSYFNVDKSLLNLVEKEGIHNAIVFIDTKDSSYSNGFQYNAPTLDTDIIFARNLEEKNIKLMEAFPGRKYFLYHKNEKLHNFELINLNHGENY